MTAPSKSLPKDEDLTRVSPLPRAHVIPNDAHRGGRFRQLQIAAYCWDAPQTRTKPRCSPSTGKRPIGKVMTHIAQNNIRAFATVSELKPLETPEKIAAAFADPKGGVVDKGSTRAIPARDRQTGTDLNQSNREVGGTQAVSPESACFTSAIDLSFQIRIWLSSVANERGFILSI
jgi:hypothetical protein